MDTAARARRGVFLLLGASFLLLAAFVLAIQGVLGPSVMRLVLAVAALLVALVLTRGGLGALRGTGPGEAKEQGDDGGDDRSA